jgi:putative adhesin
VSVPVQSTMPRLAVACLCAAVIGAPACAVDIDDEGHIEREVRRFPAENVVDLNLYTFDGAIEVHAWDRAEVVVEIEKRGPDKDAVAKIQVIAEQKGNRIHVETRHPGTGRRVFVGFGSFKSPSARLIANVPRKTNLMVRSGDGGLVVERVQGRVELRTNDGSIRVVETSGELLAESGDGGIQLDEVSGKIEARTNDGTVRLTGTPSVLHARSGDGSIVVRIRPGAVMAEDWMVATNDGSVSIELPDRFDADIEADPGGDGRALSDLRLVNSTGGTRDNRKLRGRLGEGGHVFVVRTGDGRIRFTNY